jgi:hypothetical protein
MMTLSNNFPPIKKFEGIFSTTCKGNVGPTVGKIPGPVEDGN